MERFSEKPIVVYKYHIFMLDFCISILLSISSEIASLFLCFGLTGDQSAWITKKAQIVRKPEPDYKDLHARQFKMEFLSFASHHTPDYIRDIKLVPFAITLPLSAMKSHLLVIQKIK